MLSRRRSQVEPVDVEAQCDRPPERRLAPTGFVNVWPREIRRGRGSQVAWASCPGTQDRDTVYSHGQRADSEVATRASLAHSPTHCLFSSSLCCQRANCLRTISRVSQASPSSAPQTSSGQDISMAEEVACELRTQGGIARFVARYGRIRANSGSWEGLR
jgi:hypothetical protein